MPFPPAAARYSPVSTRSSTEFYTRRRDGWSLLTADAGFAGVAPVATITERWSTAESGRIVAWAGAVDFWAGVVFLHVVLGRRYHEAVPQARVWAMASKVPGKQPPSLRIDLSADELQTLLSVAHYYQRSMGFMRHVIRATTRSATRRRLRYIADESKYLRLFVEAQQGQRSNSDDDRRVQFTPRAAIAFWGRLLSSLNTPRSRRKLSEEQIAGREQLATKLAEAIARYAVRRHDLIELEVATRREREQVWMREHLQWTPPAAEA